jgi:hydrogenase maturation protease
MLDSDRRLPSEVEVVEGGTLGLDLLDSLREVTHLLALDAVDIGADPGTLSRFVNAELLGLPVAKSVHLLGFSDLLGTLRLLEDAPDEVVMLGIQPESTGWGLNLSPSVAGAVIDLVECALAQITTWIAQGKEQGESCVSQSRAR